METIMKKYLVYISALLLICSLKMSAESAQTPNVLHVEVLIFSGRPNPVFTITDPSEIQEITALANGLPRHTTAVAKSSEEQAVLGYRGIAIENLSTIAPELQSLVVNRSSVQLNRKTAPQAKAAQSDAASSATLSVNEQRLDSAVTLQNRLLGMARSRGVINDALLEHINNTK
jgi:hypothetical protein